MIRPATYDDIAAIVGIIMEAHERMAYADTTPCAPDLDSVVTLLLDAFANRNARLLVVDVDGGVIGACGVSLSPSPWNRNVLVGTEVFWHMRGDSYTVSGNKWFLKMLTTMRDWAKDQGAKWFTCVTPPGVAGKYLERKGFSLVENTYGEVM